MLLYILIFILIIYINWLSTIFYDASNNFNFRLLVIILIIVAGFRSYDIDRDYIVYIKYYYRVTNNEYDILDLEPTFYLFSKFSSFFNTYYLIFPIYAILGVSLKAISIKKYSNLIFASLLLYFSNYYFLHEMTQIRVGVASGIFLFCIQFIYTRERKKYFYGIAIAILFHYSAVFALPLYFLDAHKIRVRVIYSFYIVAFLIFSLKLSILNMIPSSTESVFLEKIIAYKKLTEFTGDNYVNIFSAFSLISLFFNIYLLVFHKMLTSKNVYYVLLMKISSIAYVTAVLFYDFPIFSFRISEFFAVVNFCLFPMFLYTIKERWFSIMSFSLICSIYLYINLFYLKLIETKYIFFNIF